MRPEEKLEKIRKIEEQKRKYNTKYKPQLIQKFSDLLEEISKMLSSLDVEIDVPSLAVHAEHKKYREKGCIVYPAILKDGADKPKLYFIYKNDSGFMDKIEAESAPLIDIIAVSAVIPKFRKLVEGAVVDSLLKKSEEEYKKIVKFMQKCRSAYETYTDLLDTIKSLQSSFEQKNK